MPGRRDAGIMGASKRIEGNEDIRLTQNTSFALYPRSAHHRK